MHLLRNLHQLVLRNYQSVLELFEQGDQFVNGQLNLCHDLAEDITQRVHSSQCLIQQTVRRLSRSFDGGTGCGNRGLDTRQAGLDAHEKGARHHQRRGPHLVTGANCDGLIAQGARLIEFSAGSNQGAVGLLHKVSNLGPNILNQCLSGVDLVGHHTETLGQSG